jgi:hypothetical protein
MSLFNSVDVPYSRIFSRCDHLSEKRYSFKLTFLLEVSLLGGGGGCTSTERGLIHEVTWWEREGVLKTMAWGMLLVL